MTSMTTTLPAFPPIVLDAGPRRARPTDRPGWSLTTTTATRTGVGRDEDQDRVGAAPGRVVLADGMGGRRGGAIAAELAVTIALADAHEPPVAAVRRANAAIQERAAGEGLKGMGTTAVVLDLPDPASPNVMVAWVGDSRAYRVRDGVAWQVTTDHSWEAMLLELGATPDEARRRRNVLTRAVGSQPEVEVDLCTFSARPEDRFVLCSDGVHGVLAADAIAALAVGPGPAEALVAAAVAAGATDDVTAAVAHLVAQPIA